MRAVDASYFGLPHTGDGAGHTIALVDAYDNPSFVNSTDPNFDRSAWHIFDRTSGLSDPPSFTKVTQNGRTGPLIAAFQLFGWSFEIAIDIEWVHAIAERSVFAHRSWRHRCLGSSAAGPLSGCPSRAPA